MFPGTRAYNRIAHRKIVKIEARQRFPGGTVVKNLSANAGDARDTSLIPGLERSPGEGNGHPLQCSYPENSVDREAWQATVHGVRKSWTQLSDFISYYKECIMGLKGFPGGAQSVQLLRHG